MSEENTGVTVDLLNNRDRYHAEADTIRVDEGHLYVVRGGYASNEVIAIYAPGKWLQAKIGK